MTPRRTAAAMPRTLAELAALLDQRPGQLSALAARAEALYTARRRRRAAGRVRVLHVPAPELRAVQRRLATALLGRLRVSPHAFGFVRGRSAADAARRHVGQACVVRADLADFFPSVTADMVRAALDRAGLAPAVAEMITRLTTRRGRLPQGAPTSPALSNLVFRPVDARLAALARRRDLAYSRYADDLIFSGGPDTPAVLPAVDAALRAAGFRLRRAKTRVQRRGGAQTVLGLVVNDRVGVARKTRRQLRAALHRALHGGIAPPERARLDGLVAHVHGVAPDQAEPLRAALRRLGRPGESPVP